MNDVKIQDGGFIFSSGRIVWISRLWMEHTYEGCMGGTPEANSQHIRQSMCEEMRKRFGQKVTVIEPGKEVLPRLTWIAKFESAKGAKNDDPDCNSALLVRAQNKQQLERRN